MKKGQAGQVLIILLLIILVSLTVGIAIVQNSLVDLSTSTKTDQTTKAISAAEAGLEIALLQTSNYSNTTGDLGNNASASYSVLVNLPDPSKPTQALEYPPVTKADFTQFWFKDPVGSSDYTQPQFTVYFGNCDVAPCFTPPDVNNPKPAIEVNVLKKSSGGVYSSKKYLIDSDSARVSTNGFIQATCDTAGGISALTTNSPTSKFYCQILINNYLAGGDVPILARIRLLYATSAQKIALAPMGGPLPPQAATYDSKGISGETIRNVKLFKVQYVVPYFFDFAIFSEGEITK